MDVYEKMFTVNTSSTYIYNHIVYDLIDDVVISFQKGTSKQSEHCELA